MNDFEVIELRLRLEEVRNEMNALIDQLARHTEGARAMPPLSDTLRPPHAGWHYLTGTPAEFYREYSAVDEASPLSDTLRPAVQFLDQAEFDAEMERLGRASAAGRY